MLVKSSFFFCEDVRFENSGQPMFIGVTSPVMHAEITPFKIASLYLVTMFYVDSSLDSVTAKLEISAKNFDDGDEQRLFKSFSREFERGEDEFDDDDWMTLGHLNLSGLTMLDGMEISANLKINDIDETIGLKVRGEG